MDFGNFKSDLNFERVDYDEQYQFRDNTFTLKCGPLGAGAKETRFLLEISFIDEIEEKQIRLKKQKSAINHEVIKFFEAASDIFCNKFKFKIETILSEWPRYQALLVRK